MKYVPCLLGSLRPSSHLSVVVRTMEPTRLSRSPRISLSSASMTVSASQGIRQLNGRHHLSLAAAVHLPNPSLAAPHPSKAHIPVMNRVYRLSAFTEIRDIPQVGHSLTGFSATRRLYNARLIFSQAGQSSRVSRRHHSLMTSSTFSHILGLHRY